MRIWRRRPARPATFPRVRVQLAVQIDGVDEHRDATIEGVLVAQDATELRLKLAHWLTLGEDGGVKRTTLEGVTVIPTGRVLFVQELARVELGGAA